MAALTVEGDELMVRLGPWERMGAVRGDVRVPLSAVSSVAVEPDPWRALRGLRAPGAGWPGVIAYGVWRRWGERPDFNAVFRQGPAVCVELDRPARFGRLLVSADDADAVVSRLSGAR